MKGKNQNGPYPGTCSRQVPNMFKLTKIGPPKINGMPNHPYNPSIGLLAQSSYFCHPLTPEQEHIIKKAKLVSRARHTHFATV